MKLDIHNITFTKKNIGICVAILISISLLCGMYYVKENERKEDLLQNAQMAVSALYDEQGTLHEGVDKDTVEEVRNKVNLVEYDDQKQAFLKQLIAIDDYLIVVGRIDELFQDDILKSDVEKGVLDEIQVVYDTLDPTLKSAIDEKLKLAFTQHEAIQQAIDGVDSLFDENDYVIEDINREAYENAVALLEALPQTDVYERYQESLQTVLVVIEDKEEAQRIREEQKRIADNNHVLSGVPLLNQLQAKIYNGCEVGSLLMGMQYRGVARDMSFHQIADAVPKTDNPHTGFVSDIYAFEPRNIAHWIAPDALAAFGQTMYPNVVNISGASPEALMAEIDAGNPVVVYGTDKYNMPSTWDGEIPLTNHVQLLIGYNSYLGTYILNDPVYNQVNIPKAQFERVYNLNRFAVSIR